MSKKPYIRSNLVTDTGALGTAEKVGSEGGGGAENAVLYVSQSLNSTQKAQARANIGAISLEDVPAPVVTIESVNGQVGVVVLDADDVGAAPAETVQSVSGSTPTITPAANTIYNCGELTSLTVTNPPAQGAYSIVFTSGATATTTTIPSTILGLESFAADANTLYEINVLDSRAVFKGWTLPGVSA